MNTPIFDRPLIIVAAPRSGSSFLFELLSTLTDFYTIGGESHQIIESIPQFNLFQNKQLKSNVLTEKDVNPQTKKLLLESLTLQMRNNQNKRWLSDQNRPSEIRFLEKTPKNALRIGMLLEVFPDARFLYLYREPKSNISSIIDAWNSERFITYPSLDGRISPWSLLLPDEWQDYSNASVEEIATFQWEATNNAIVEALTKISRESFIAINYDELLSNTTETLKDICDFSQISYDFSNINIARTKSSSHTLTKHDSNKWKKNTAKLEKVLPKLQGIVVRLQDFLPQFKKEQFDLSIIKSSEPKLNPREKELTVELNTNRNAPCHCNSGKRFKHCHGNIE